MGKDVLKQFFLYRMTECFNKNTIDSYRVRSNNAISLLYETYDVVKSWCKHRIKSFDTVKYVIEECICAIDKATCLAFENCPKELLLKELEDFKKSGSSDYVVVNRLLYYVDSCIEENNKEYLNRLFLHTRRLLTNEEEIKEGDIQSLLESLDRDVTEFACELIRVGYSKIYLFYYFKSLLDEMKKGYDNFISKYDEIYVNLIACELGKYSVIFILSAPKEYSSFDGFLDSVPNDIVEKVDKEKRKQFKQNNTRKIYCIRDIEALDEYCAIKKVREEISQILDYRQNGPEHQTIRIPFNAFVGKKNSENEVDRYKSRIVYLLDVSRIDNHDDLNYLSKAMEHIENDKRVEEESKSRIKSALRHLRIGDGQLEIEQRFINYWIGLEFLFSSPEISDSTFMRMKQYLISIMTSCYVKRNILNLVDWMKEFDCSIDVFKDSSSIDSFTAKKGLNILMFYRLKRMKKHLHHTDKTVSYISTHRTNLEQHLSRLYRYRNELIHEGAIKQNMENLTSNLRYYLVFVLNLCIDYFCREREYKTDLTMDSFFWEYEKYLKLFSLNKNKNYKYEYLMRVPLQNKYLR